MYIITQTFKKNTHIHKCKYTFQQLKYQLFEPTDYAHFTWEEQWWDGSSYSLSLSQKAHGCGFNSLNPPIPNRFSAQWSQSCSHSGSYVNIKNVSVTLLPWNDYAHPWSLHFFFFFCVWCDDHAKFSGWWLLGSPLSPVVWQLARRAWYPLWSLH